MSVRHGNKLLFSNNNNNKKSLSQRKGAFSCDLRHLQMEEFAVRLMMVRVDME